MSAISKIAVYVTGHGFGHAVRSVVVLSELRQLMPTLRIVIKTDAPSWLFSSLDGGAVTIIKQRADQAPRQEDAFTLHCDKTVEDFEAWVKLRNRWISREAEWLTGEEISLVIADISPLALGAAARAGIPSALVANFTWDWILESLFGVGGPAQTVVEQLRYYVEHADWLFEVEPAAPAAHPRPVRVGLIARRCPLAPDAARKVLGIPEEKRAILVSFGGIGVRDVDFSALNRHDEFLFMSTQPLQGLKRCLVLDPKQIDHACLMRASDAVVGKLGYGTVAEALVHGTPFLFSPRGDWPEESVLRKAVESRLPSIAVPMHRFRRGDWIEELRSVAKAERSETRLPFGGRQIAETLAAFLTHHTRMIPRYYPAQNHQRRADS